MENNAIYLQYKDIYKYSADYLLPYAIYKNNIMLYFADNGYGYNAYGNYDGDSGVLSQTYASTYLNNVWCQEPKGKLSRDYGVEASVIDDVEIPSDSIFPNYDWKDVLIPAYPINPGLGSDGTPRGPLGGTGFTDRPSLPRITARDIDLNPDAEGKLNVKISVSAE